MSGYTVAGIALFCLLLILCLPVGVRGEYTQEGAGLWLRLGAVNVKLLPGKAKGPKKPGRKKAETKTGEKRPPKKEKEISEKVGGGLALARELLPVALDAAGQFRKKLRLDEISLRLTIPGGDDPARAAMLYGNANAVLGFFWSTLNETFAVKNGSAQIRVDFQAREMTLYACGSLSLRVYQTLWLGTVYGVRALVGFLRYRRGQKSRKVA